MGVNFGVALTSVLAHEGGYVDHPKDPGGATNRGITQVVYDDWRITNSLPCVSVKDITTAEVMAIYRSRYWNRINGDELPTGVDYCTFDFAVNSGVNRAARYLQKAVGATEDGQIGPTTLKAVKAKNPAVLIDAVCNARMAFLKRLPIFNTFGKGWSHRVEDVRAKAKEMMA